jgi:hypothetical protein
MPHHIPNLPALAAGLNIPVLGVVNHLVKAIPLCAHDIQHLIFAAVSHWIDCHGLFSFTSFESNQILSQIIKERVLSERYFKRYFRGPFPLAKPQLESMMS